MRKFLIVTLTLMLVLGLSGVALADNDLYLNQNGSYNVALVGQVAEDFDNRAYIDQNGDDLNFTMLMQAGKYNYGDVDQYNASLNVALTEQIACTPFTWGWFTGADQITIQDKIHWAIEEIEWMVDRDTWDALLHLL